MPYTIAKRDGEFCVYKKDADGNPMGESLGCHPTEKEAVAQIGAIESNSSEKMMMRPTQAEAQYVTLSGEAGKACANCRWFDGSDGGGYCHLIENYPEDILPTGYCSRWEGKPVAEEPTTTTIEADSVLVLPPMEMGSMARSEDKAGRVLSKRNAGKITSALMAIKDVLLNAGLVNMEDMPDAMSKGTFTVFKANGKDYWKAVWTNNFKDRDGEILSETAHDRYLARVEKKLVPMPELWYWHIPGTKHGQALWLGRVDHLMLAVGGFDETPRARAFIKGHRKSREKVSHGFHFPTWAKKDGVYLDYNTFEISPLPPDAAANPYTGFEGSTDMAISEAQRAGLIRLLGEKEATEILAEAEQKSKEIEKGGVAYKDYADVPAAEQAAKAKSADDAESKALNALMAALEGQNELMKRQDELEAASKGYALKFEALEKAQTEQKAANEALAKENAELREKMRMTPRASQNADTAVTDEQLQKTMEERVGDYDPMWLSLGLKAPKTGGNNG